MGMYTELVAGFDIADLAVAKILEFMINGGDEPDPLPEHPLFKTDRWKYMLGCGSYYFAGPTISKIRFDDISNRWEVAIRCNLKNYGDEIAKFISWIDPYIVCPANGTFYGYSRYEEYKNTLTMYYVGGEEIKDFD